MQTSLHERLDQVLHGTLPATSVPHASTLEEAAVAAVELKEVEDPRKHFRSFFSNFVFPAGEVHVQFDNEGYDGQWESYLEYAAKAGLSVRNLDSKYPYEMRLEIDSGDSAQFLTTIAMADAARRMGVRAVDLLLLYTPYGRQDRVSNPGEAMMLRYVVNLINVVFRHITLIDGHSDVTSALLRPNSKIIKQYEVMKLISNHLDEEGSYNPFTDDEVILVSPDAGASKKIGYVAQTFGKLVAQASKVRDSKTGELGDFHVRYPDVSAYPDSYGSKFLIVDDCIDGGGTFVGLAQSLRYDYPKAEIMLAASFGIMSKGFAPFQKSKFNHVYVGDMGTHPEALKLSNSNLFTNVGIRRML